MPGGDTNPDVIGQLDARLAEFRVAETPKQTDPEKEPTYRDEMEAVKTKHPDVYERFKKTDTEYEELVAQKIKEVKQKEKTPPHDEISAVHKESTLIQKLKMDLALVQKAFETLNLATENPSGRPELDIGSLTEEDPANVDWDAKRKPAGKPQIFFKQITREATFWEKKLHKTSDRVPTGQVLVVISEANGKTAEDNTVVTMTVGHKGGKLVWGENQRGLYNVQSEREYRDKVGKNPAASTCEDRVARGELTIGEYNRQFVREDPKKRTSAEYWTDHDAEVTKPYKIDLTNPHARKEEREFTRHKESIEQKRGRIFESLGNEYSKRLQELQAVANEILEGVNSAVEAVDRRNNEILAGSLFQEILKSNDARYIAGLERAICMYNGISMAELRALENENKQKNLTRKK